MSRRDCCDGGGQNGHSVTDSVVDRVDTGEEPHPEPRGTVDNGPQRWHICSPHRRGLDVVAAGSMRGHVAGVVGCERQEWESYGKDEDNKMGA